MKPKKQTTNSITESLPGSVPLIVIGGGMAGLCGAIEAAKGGYSVLVLDAGKEPGRKILATGNGRCNITNYHQDKECYRSDEPKEAERLGLGRQELAGEVVTFLKEELGVLCHERNGYVYPRTDQASTIQKALIARTRELGVRICSNVRAEDLIQTGDGRYQILVAPADEAAQLSQLNQLDGGPLPQMHRITADAVILATGGLVSDQYGCRGAGYFMAQNLGHHCAVMAPALCSIRIAETEKRSLSMAAGIRTHGKIALYEDGQKMASSEGELQLTAEGISGIPAFQVSRYLNKAYASKEQSAACKKMPVYTAALDFLPELGEDLWEQERAKRLAKAAVFAGTLQDFCLGLVPDRVASWLIADLGAVAEQKVRKRIEREGLESTVEFLQKLLDAMRCKELTAVPSFEMSCYEKAQVTAGGVLLSEIQSNMESRYAARCYFAGELLDVDGMCGGYNLTFAIHSGLLAGRAAANSR